jgi:polyhydroxybutyrate depolymerase
MRLSIVGFTLLSALLLSAAPASAATVQSFVGAHTGVIGDLTVSDPKKAGRLSANMVLSHGRLLTLLRGTAAFDISFVHDGAIRRFLVLRPEPANANAAALMMLHGAGGTPEAQANLTTIGATVRAQGLWAVLPEAAVDGWNDDPGLSNGNDDVGFNAKVIDILTGYLQLDARRIFVSGLSAGGFMAERLACELSDRIAAAAIVAGTISGNLSRVCSPAAPRPILFINGTADPIVPYDGGRLGVMSAPDAYALWQTLHNCTASASTSTALADRADDGTTTTLARNAGCGSGGEVRQYIVTGGGHTWPGGRQYLPASMIGRTSRDFSANDEIWSFFAAHPR